MIDEEYWQGYQLNGEPSRPITKLEARNGALHAASHVWIWRRLGDQVQVLVQKRAQDKLTWPGFMDISAAGHVDAGESPIAAAAREAYEEINLKLNTDELRLLFVRYADDDAGSGVREREFVWVYLYALLQTAKDLNLTDGEVESVQWLSIDEFDRLGRGELANQKLVPHVYFPDLITALHQLN